jgi:hypothetical protein
METHQPASLPTRYYRPHLPDLTLERQHRVAERDCQGQRLLEDASRAACATRSRACAAPRSWSPARRVARAGAWRGPARKAGVRVPPRRAPLPVRARAPCARGQPRRRSRLLHGDAARQRACPCSLCRLVRRHQREGWATGAPALRSGELLTGHAGDEDLPAERERERRRGEQVCACGHARRQHAMGSGAGLDRCLVTLPSHQICPCALFRLARGHQRGDA